jgi:beta-1,2-mannobiose phosphorylase / 1,2-beta-oligomannan phosphorylase
VVRHSNTYYMFAEGEHDNHAVMLTSQNGIDWKWQGELDVRLADGKRSAPKPCGTPTVWIENDKWYLFYERNDKGVWLATTNEPLRRIWTNVRDEAVLRPGPAEYDKDMIAVDQIIKYRGAYFAFYHGSGTAMPRTWNTDLACSTDLVHWRKYEGNPIVNDNKSSGVVVPFRDRFRLYTMHDQVDVFESRAGK